ncbi:MAG: HAD-IA family hydrolase [Lysobacterales bacterium]|jgi:phosphoglycolate phosphatase
MNPVKAMLFDLDGTLLDSAPDLVGSLNWVRESESLPPLELREMSRFASKGAVGLLKAGMPQTDPETLETWRRRFLEHYAVNSFRQSSLFHGVLELLDYLDDAGVPWGIVTNKIESLTMPILEAADLDERVACVVCGDTLRESKPHPAPVRLACGMLEVSEATAIFVGDDIRDIEAGRAAGTQTAAVYYGYGSYEFDEEFVRGSFPVHHPADLTQLVR